MKPVLTLTAAAFFWGLNFHLARVMLKSVGFMEAGSWRYFFGVLLLGLLAGRKSLSIKMIKENIRGISLVGIIGLFGFNLFFFSGLRYTTALNAALIISLNPALTLLFSNRILKTPLPPLGIAGIVISMAGVIYLMAKGSLANLQEIKFGAGDLLIFLSNILFALHHVWVKKYAHHVPVIHFTLYTNVLCMLCFMLILPFTGIKEVYAHSGSFWFAATGIGFLGTALAYYLWNFGIKEAGADRAGIFMNVVPLSAAVLAVFFGEPLYRYHFICGVIITSGVMLTIRSARKGKKRKLYSAR